MSETKIFRKKDLDLEPVNGMKTIGLVNVSFSDKLGAGIGVFEDCSIPWHITYDEVIYILDGSKLFWTLSSDAYNDSVPTGDNDTFTKQ